MSDTTHKTSFPSLRAIVALILREMSTTYGRSPGGYLWALLEPIAGIAVLTIVFSLLFRSPPIGTNFPLFYATGMLPLAMYMGLAQKVSVAIQFSKPLLTYPKVTFIDAILARLILDIVTEILIWIVIVTGIIWLFDLPVVPDLLAVFNSFGMIIALGLGVGLVNSFLNNMFPIWAFIWAVVNRPLFIISGVFFIIDYLPDQYRKLLFLNPVAHVVSEMRRGFYPSYPAVYVSEVYVYGISLVLMAIGLALLYRYHNDILET